MGQINLFFSDAIHVHSFLTPILSILDIVNLKIMILFFSCKSSLNVKWCVSISAMCVCRLCSDSVTSHNLKRLKWNQYHGWVQTCLVNITNTADCLHHGWQKLDGDWQSLLSLPFVQHFDTCQHSVQEVVILNYHTLQFVLTAYGTNIHCYSLQSKSSPSKPFSVMNDSKACVIFWWFLCEDGARAKFTTCSKCLWRVDRGSSLAVKHSEKHEDWVSWTASPAIEIKHLTCCCIELSLFFEVIDQPK